MSEDVLYEAERQGDREAAAAYLRQLADRLAAGEQLLPADRGDPLVPPEAVAVTVRATEDETGSVAVDLGLEWAAREQAASTDTESEERAGASGENGGSGESSDDRRQATGWASAGASDGYTLPRIASLDDADDEFERAAYFLAKGKHDAAVSRFENAVEQSSTGPRSDAPGDAVEQAPDDPRYRYVTASVCWKLGRTDRAADHFQTAAELAPADPTIQLDYAAFCWSQGRIDAARERYERALEVAPEHPDVHSALGRFRWETESDIEAAVDHLERALSLDDEHGLAHCNYAVLLRHGGKHDRAEDHFQRALELRAEDPIVQTEYGHFLWERGDIEAAARHYARAE